MNPSKKTLIVIYLIFVVIFAWRSAQQKAAPLPVPVRIISDAKSFVLPATPTVSLINDSDKDVTLDTCKDIEVIANGIQKTALPQAFCRIVTVPAKTVGPLFGNTKEDILTFQSSFESIPDTALVFSYTQPTTTNHSEVALTIGHAGYVRLFFRTVFYNPVYNFFAALIVLLPNHSLGWATIITTLIIRLALLIPQQKMLVSQRRMQVIQPKIKAIQEEFKGDQAKIGAKMMELYKRE